MKGHLREDDMKTDGKRLHIKTWGCQMNVYDSSRMAELLAPHGYRLVDTADDADMVILNTCHIRERATEKVFSDLGRLRGAKAARAAAGGRMVVAVAGCVAQAEGEEILRRAPVVDVVVGPQAYHRLPEMLATIERGADVRAINTDFPVEQKFDLLPGERQTTVASAFLSIQEGCDKFCTFCVVPYTRGAEYSRTVEAILAEARSLVEGGAVEVTLLGQNVNAFHGEGPDGRVWGLGRLLRELAHIDGLRRLRYTTSHPRDMDDELLRAHRDLPSLMPFLHLPVQSGSDRILKGMNRKHTADNYRRAVDRLREARDDIALSSDFIVGFPGETDADFAETLRLINDVGFAQAYSFKYSPRPGTPAAALPNQIPDDVKSERLTALQQLVDAQQLAFNQTFLGRRIPVLIERPGRRPGQMQGRSPWMQSVNIVAPASLTGRITEVDIGAAHQNSLSGRLTRDNLTPHLTTETAA